MKDLGSIEHVLGMRITRDRQQQLLYILQEKYIAIALSVPLLPHVKLSK